MKTTIEMKTSSTPHGWKDERFEIEVEYTQEQLLGAAKRQWAVDLAPKLRTRKLSEARKLAEQGAVAGEESAKWNAVPARTDEEVLASIPIDRLEAMIAARLAAAKRI